MQIELQEAVKTYGKVTALDGITLTFEPGEIVAVLGLNGAGKSTLLNSISGLISLSSGQVTYDKRPFRFDDLELRRKIMFIADVPDLIWDESVIRNISIFATQYHRLEDQHLTKRVVDFLEEAEVLHKSETPVSGLSRGQIYKTALAILQAVDPQLWILDEPFASGMDANGIRLFRKTVEQARKERARTIIYSTQLAEMAIGFATRICIIDQGKCYAQFSPDEFVERAVNDPLLSKMV